MLYDVVIRIDMYVLTWPLPNTEQFIDPYVTPPTSHHNSGNDPEKPKYVGSIKLTSIDEDDDNESTKDSFVVLNELPKNVSMDG